MSQNQELALLGNYLDVDSSSNYINIGQINRIINGDMRINQRNTAVSTDLAYSVDRWRFFKSNDATESVAQSTDAPTSFSHSLRNTVTIADTSIGATQYSGFRQAIEGVNIVDWAFGTASAKQITISFWIKSTVTGVYSGNITNYAETRICPFTYTINASNTWEYKTYTFPGDTSGTWVTDTNGSMSLNLYSALGSSYYGGTAGVWGTSPNYGAGGASLVNALATNGNIFAITGVQLETGTVATPFERRHFGNELALCQRYYYRHTAVTAYATAGAGRAYSTTNGQAVIMLPVPLRAAPGSTGYSSLAHWDGAGSGSINSLSPASEYASDFRTFSINIGMSYTAGQSVILNARNTIGAWIEWSADI